MNTQVVASVVPYGGLGVSAHISSYKKLLVAMVVLLDGELHVVDWRSLAVFGFNRLPPRARNALHLAVV